jgi:hypothetical protein
MNETLINSIAKILGTSVNSLVAVYVKQAFMNGFISCFWVALLIFLDIKIFLFFKKKSQTGGEIDNPFSFIIFICSIIFAAISCLVIPCLITEAFVSFTNPQYWAVDHILSNFKSN